MAAANMLEKARRATQEMKEEMATLQTQKKALISRLRHVLKSQLELIEVLEPDDADLAQIKDRTKKVFSGVKTNSESLNSDKKKANNENINLANTTKNNPEDIKKEKLHGEDLFKDIFGDNINIDGFLK